MATMVFSMNIIQKQSRVRIIFLYLFRTMLCLSRPRNAFLHSCKNLKINDDRHNSNSFFKALQKPILDVNVIRPNVVLITWNSVNLAQSHHVTLYLETFNNRTEIVSCNMRYIDCQPSISFRNLNQDQMYSVYVKAISADEVHSLSGKVTFKPGERLNGCKFVETLCLK